MYNQTNPVTSTDDADKALELIQAQQLEFLTSITPEPTDGLKTLSWTHRFGAAKWVTAHDTFEAKIAYQNDQVGQSQDSGFDRDVFNSLALYDPAEWAPYPDKKIDYNTPERAVVPDPRAGQPKPSKDAKFAHSMQAFWLDVDTKDYYDPATGFTADFDFILFQLKNFIEQTNGEMLEYHVVKSGGGMHVYFPLCRPVPAKEWMPIAARLDRLIKKEGFKVDGKCTIDAARVLRLPWTINFKKDYAPDYPTVEWYTAADEPNELETIIDWLDANKIPAVKAPKLTGEPAKTFPAQANDRIYKGCAVVKHIVDEINATGATRGMHDDFVKVASQYAYLENGPDLLASALPSYVAGRDERYGSNKQDKWFKIWLDSHNKPYGCDKVAEDHAEKCSGCPLQGLHKAPLNLCEYDYDIMSGGAGTDGTGGTTSHASGPQREEVESRFIKDLDRYLGDDIDVYGDENPVILNSALKFLRASVATHSDNNVLAMLEGGTSKVKIEKSESTRRDIIESIIDAPLFKSNDKLETAALKIASLDEGKVKPAEKTAACNKFRNKVLDMLFTNLRTCRNVLTMKITTDHFAQSAKILMGEMNQAETIIPMPTFGKDLAKYPLLLNGPETADDVWNDYLEHNPAMTDILDFVTGSWFASNSREASLWLHANAGTGKTMLMEGVLAQRLGLVFRTTMPQIKELFKTQASSIEPVKIIGRPIVFIDEATGGGAKELKDMEFLPVAPKYGMQQEIRTHCRILASKETLDQLVGSGVEDQFSDRFTYIRMTGGKLKKRKMFNKVGRLQYVNAVAHKAYEYIAQKVADYKSDPATATFKADKFMMEFHDKHAITNTFEHMDDTIDTLAQDILVNIRDRTSHDFTIEDDGVNVVLDDRKRQDRNLMFARTNDGNMVGVADFRPLVSEYVKDNMTKIKIAESSIVKQVEDLWIAAGGKVKSENGIRVTTGTKGGDGSVKDSHTRKRLWLIDHETLKKWDPADDEPEIVKQLTPKQQKLADELKKQKEGDK